MKAVAREKAALRKILLDRRRKLAGGTESAGARLAQHFMREIPVPPAAAISAFVPIRGEIDVTPLTGELRREGHSILLPVTPAVRGALGFRLWRDGGPLIDGAFGTRVPPPAAPAATPDLLIVPLLGFDRTGRRIGYGGGYYDRTLCVLRGTGRVTAVGVGFAAQEVPRVPHHRGDEILDWIVTEEEVITVPGRSGTT